MATTTSRGVELNRNAGMLAAVIKRRMVASSIRGNVDAVPLGCLPWYDVKGPHLISHDSGAFYQNGGRVHVTTSVISKTYNVPENYEITSYESIIDDFIKYEADVIRNRLLLNGNIVYGEPLKVEQLRKFFKDLGKPNVIVLPNDEVVDINDSSFKLVVRNDLCVEILANPSTSTMQYVLWEDVGFMYRLEKNYDPYIRSYPSAR